MQELGFVHESGHMSQYFKTRMQEDVKKLCSVLTTTHEYNNKMQDGEQLCNIHDKTGKNGQFKKLSTKYNPLTMVYLTYAWGVPPKYPTRLMQQSSTPKSGDERAYHKNHIKKVMDVAVTAYDSNVKNGGDGVKIGLFCVQGAHVAKQDVRES